LRESLDERQYELPLGDSLISYPKNFDFRELGQV
jgi:hypothetical protein